MNVESQGKKLVPSNGKSFYSEKEIQGYTRDLIMGLDYIHSQRIVHCDIKPQNILIDEYNKAKLADFGTAQILPLDSDVITQAKGTFDFLSPECCNPQIKQFSGKALDIWALGVTIYCMAFNELPFSDQGVSVIKAIQNNQ